MKTAYLVGLLALSFLAAQDASAPDAVPKRPLPPDVGEGHVAWFDLTTHDLARSKAFYTELFGWTYGPVPGTDLAVEIVASDRAIGSLRVAEGALSPFDGVVYVQVADLRGKCAKAAELGGRVAPGFPFDLPGERGAIALLLDPAGHPIGMYSRTPIGPEPTAEK